MKNFAIAALIMSVDAANTCTGGLVDDAATTYIASGTDAAGTDIDTV